MLVGVKVLVHVAVPVVPAARLHMVKVPVAPVVERATVPVGVVTPVVIVSVTVAAHVEAELRITGVSQTRVVVVG